MKASQKKPKLMISDIVPKRGKNDFLVSVKVCDDFDDNLLLAFGTRFHRSTRFPGFAVYLCMERQLP